LFALRNRLTTGAPVATMPRTMLLTKHENKTFENQTVYISGQAFINCKFIACTLVLRETIYHLDQCTFERCNWHVDWVLLWGSPESIREIKSLVGMIEQAQQQAIAAGQLPAGQPTAGNATTSNSGGGGGSTT
jgi:hypothetical protein